ncbi:MAG: molybdopterin-dependent oxidoreductase [Chlorobium sp.]|nr:molybdopterin-dependent oxidoreductase [Chlorobium sp.]
MVQTRRDFLKRTAALSAASYLGIILPFNNPGNALAADSTTWHRGSCRLCGAGCRLELGVTNGLPTALRGIPQSRTNLGFLCMKGMHFWKVMNHKDRLTTPLYREKKTDKFKKISWEQALEIAAQKFAGAIKEHGPNSVAYYGSGQALTEETYLFQKIFRGGLKSNNVEGNPRLCMASAVGGYMSSFGADEPIGGYADIEKADCFFIIGANMAEAHPVLFRRVMRRKLDNPKVTVINADPRISLTSRIADIHLQFKPGTDLALLNSMAFVIVDEKLYNEQFITDYAVFKKGKDEAIDFEGYKASLADYTPEKASVIMGGKITADQIREVARKFATSKGTLSMWTMGLNQRKQGVWANNLVHNLHILTGQLLTEGADSLSLTGQPNACGGVREAGGLCHILPGHRPIEKEPLRNQVEEAWGIPKGRIPAEPGLHTMAMFGAVNEGKIKAMWINCTSPVQSLPNCNHYNKGMAKDDTFIVCTDIFPTLTTELAANLVLPTAFHFEKTGVYGCTERRSQITRKAINPPKGAKPEVEIVREWAVLLAKKLEDPVIEICVKPFLGLEPHYALPKAIWDEYTQKLTKGRDSDLTGATYEVLEGMFDGVQWPAPTEEFAKTGGTVKKFVRSMDPLAEKLKTDDKPYQFYGPAHADKKLWIWARPQANPEEIPDAEYPFYLSTGRIIDHWHTMSMTGRIPELLRANPYSFIEINPKDAEKLGIKPGDMVEITSRRGVNTMPAKVYEGPIEGMVFAYWHDQHPDRMINKTTIDAIDPGSKEPEFKICACKIKRVSGPVSLTPYIV